MSRYETKNTCFYNVMEAITENKSTRNAVETNKPFKDGAY